MADIATNETVSFAQSLIGLMPVIVGGVVGAISTIVGGFILHNIQAIERKENFTTEKIEKAALLAYECKEWIEKYENERLFSGEIVEQPWPLNELKVLCSLYIPNVKDKLNLLEVSFIAYKKVVLGKAQEKRDTGKIPDNLTESIKQVYVPFSKAIDDFVSELQKISKP